MSDAHPLGRFTWYNLMTSDPQGAVDFYTRVIGWNTVLWEGPGYTMWANGETTLGGLRQLPDDAESPPHWVAYVATPDLDATLGKATGLGAAVMVPSTPIPTVGRFAVIRDPQGAYIALFTADGEAAGHDGPPEVGEFSWHELMTTDHAAAFDFYHALFDWEKDEAFDMGPMGVYQLFSRHGVQQGGIFNKPDEVPVPAWLYYVRVDDADAAAERVKAAGGQVVNGPMEVPGGDRIAQCTDPQGAMFAMHSKKK